MKELKIYPVEVITYQNEYKTRMKDHPFVEQVRIDPMTGVYKKWETTHYEILSMPMAQGLS